MSSDPSPSQEEEVYPFLRYQCTTGTGQRQDSGGYLLNLKVRILCEFCPEGSSVSHEVQLGDIQATLIRVGRAGNEGFPLYELFDDSQEIHDLSSALFQPGYEEFVEPVQEKFPFAFPYEDLLYIRWFTLQPIVRGQRAGISALHRLMTDWETGCSLIAIEPLPMQFLPEVQDGGAWPDLQLGSFPQDRSAAAAKVENHLGGLGFQKIDPLPYMLLSPAKMQAPLQELALEDTLTLPGENLEELL